MMTRGVVASEGEGTIEHGREYARRHCQLEQSEGDFRRFASAIHQVACDV